MKKTNHWLWTGMMLLFVALLMAGCSSEGGSGGGEEGGTDAGVPAEIVFKAFNSIVPIGGVITITANIKDTNGNNVADATQVTLSDQQGLVTITPASQLTVDGKATFVVTGQLAGIANLICQAGGAIATISITIVDTAPTIVLMVDNTNILVGQVIEITATVMESDGTLVADDSEITFDLSDLQLAELDETTALTTSGVATVNLTARQTGTVVVGATYGAGTGTLELTITEPVPTQPANITLTASSAVVLVGGEISLTANVTDDAGAVVQDGTTVEFSIDTDAGSLSTGNGSTISGSATTMLSGEKHGTVTVLATAGSISSSVTITVTADVDDLTLTTTKTSIKTDNVDSATITATAVDGNGVPMPDVPVTFRTSYLGQPSGQLSAFEVLTDENGQAEVLFSSGGSAENKANRTVVINASAPGGATGSIPVQLTGTTIALAIDNTSLQGQPVSSSTNLTATVRDGGGVAIYGAELDFSQDPGLGSASVLFSQGGAVGSGGLTNVQTNVIGQAVVQVEGSNGDAFNTPVMITVSGLNVEATRSVTVSGQPFEILAPTSTTTGALDDVFTFANGTGTITRSDAVSFITQGFAFGDVIGVTSSSTTNDGLYTITAVSATTLTVAETIANEVPAPGVFITITRMASEESVIVADTNDSVLLGVRSPDGDNVSISTTMGTLSTTLGGAGTSPLIASPPASNIVEVWLNTLGAPGTATIIAENTTDNLINDSLQVAIAAPSSEAFNVYLQASPSVIAPSTGGITNIADLKIEVTNATNQVVNGAPVRLRMLNPIGGGEDISPPVVYSDTSGEATATFTAGSKVSDSKGVLCIAQLDTAPTTGPQANAFYFDSVARTISVIAAAALDFRTLFLPGDRILVTGSNSNDWVFQIATGGVAELVLTLTDDPLIRGDDITDEGVIATPSPAAITIKKVDAVQIVIGGQASSVAIGTATEIESYSLSIYKTQMSVVVSDSNGNPVPGAVVNMSVWPLGYWTGPPGWPVCCFTYYPNEDQNRNEVMDGNEDNGSYPADGNSVLDPVKSAAGVVPATLITDENGLAEFDFLQQKVYAAWTSVEFRATVVVYGSETISILQSEPYFMASEVDSMPGSPWGDWACLEACP